MVAMAIALMQTLNNISKQIMSRQDFHAIPIIPINRNVQHRLAKVAKLLKTPALTHYEVAVVRFIENGQEILWRINGNTRDEIWHNNLIDASLIPSDLFVTIYDVKDRKEAEKLYYTIDSSESAESGSEKITGIFAKLGLIFRTDKIKKGILTKILEFASQGTPVNRNGGSLKDHNREPVVKHFREELIELDKICIGKSNLRFKNAAMWCMALMALKKYSNNDAKLAKVIAGLKRIKNNQLNTESEKWDGITHILNEWGSGKHGGELVGVQGGTCSVSMPRQLDFLLFHFNNYMDDVYESEKVWSSRTQRKNSKKSNDYFFNKWYTL